MGWKVRERQESRLFFFFLKKHSYEREQSLEIKRVLLLGFFFFFWFLRGKRPLREGETDAEGQSKVTVEEALSQEAGKERIRAHRWR